MLNLYATFYVEANIFCIVIFLILIFRSLNNIDRQAKQRIFDNILISHILYFSFDCIWCLILYRVIPLTHMGAVLANLGDNIFLLFLTCFWFVYVEMDQGETYILDKRNRLKIYYPTMILFVLQLVCYLFLPSIVFTDDYKATLLGSLLFLGLPIIYILASSFRSIKRAFAKKNIVNRQKFLLWAFYPVAVVLFGLLQISGITLLPIFCLSCTALMIFVYLVSLDNLVRIDPLTGLNNRAQLNQYINQEEMKEENHYILMIDLNDFKSINDKFGHVEGDNAIIFAANTIKNATLDNQHRPFICRYGGDEFLVIIQTNDENDAKALKDQINNEFDKIDLNNSYSYRLTASIGIAPFLGDFNAFQASVKEADTLLYQEKELFHNLHN